MIAALSPHRALDDGYRGFFELAAAQVVTAIRNATAYQEERRRAEALAARSIAPRRNSSATSATSSARR
jgi:GAF domain-containing protein